MPNKLFILLLFVPLLSFSQNAQEKIDDLMRELRTNPDTKKTASIYSDLTWYYTNVSIDSALSYGAKAIEISVKLGDSTLIAQVYSDVAAACYRKGDYQNSKINYLKANKIRSIRKDYSGMAKVKANLANIYNKEGEKDLALQSYLESIDYFEKTGNYNAASLTKANVGYLFHEIKNYPKAMSYLKEAIVYQENNHLDDGLCTSYLTLGNVYLKMKDTSNAILSYRKSINYSKKTGNKIALASAYVNMGNIKSLQNNPKEAISLFNTSKQIRDSINIGNEESILSLNLVKEKLRQSDLEAAKRDLLKLKNIYETATGKDENLTETYQLLIETYAYLNKPDSVTYYVDKESKLKNEILETAVVKQTNELEAKYQTAKKEKLLLQKEIEARHKNLLIAGISLVAFLIALIALLIYHQQKTKNYQQDQEYRLKIAISKIETQNELQNQRLAISRDLHDNIGAELTFIISSIDNLNYAFDIADPKLKHRLSMISAFASDTIIELRDTIWAMNHTEITFEDLQSRISNFMEKAKAAKEQTNFVFTIDAALKHTKLSSVNGMNIYRTIQEAVNNSIKYACSTEIRVEAKRIGSEIQVKITDNGIGFNETETEKGNGLLNMQKRIESIGGSFQLKSIPGKGTVITLLLKNITPW